MSKEIIALVRRGKVEELVVCLATLSPSQRRELAGPVKQLGRAEGGIQQTSLGGWRAADERITRGLVVAGAGCLASANEVAAWLERYFAQSEHAGWIAQVLADRGPEWTGQVANAHAARLPLRDTFMLEHRWEITARLAAAARVCPTHDGFVLGWLMKQGYGSGVTVLERLRVDPFLDDLLPRVFEVDGAGVWLAALSDRGGPGMTAFPAALATLATEGRLDRVWLLDACLGRFLRGGPPRTLKGFLHLHQALAPTLEEIRARVRDYVRVLPDAPGPVATLAQEALRALDKAGSLDLDLLLEASSAVLRRPEKALVRAQLTWLSTVVKLAPVPVLDVVAYAFAHPDLAVQERALALVEKHIDACDETVRSRLGEAAQNLGADLPARAATSLGIAPGVGVVPVATAPAVRASRHEVAPIASVAELAAELAALEHDRHGLERVLDATIRFAATDRAGLLAAVAPVMARREKTVAAGSAYTFDLVLDVVRSARDTRLRRTDAAQARARSSSMTHVLQRVIVDRLVEAALCVTTRPVPFLLATPTVHTGHIDPHVLVDRVAAAEEGGWQPWPTDLAQALLRLPRAIDPGARDRARDLRSSAGQRLASVLATGIPDPVTRRVVVRRHREWYEPAGDRKRPDHRALVAVAGEPPDPLVARVFALDPPAPFGFGDEAMWPEVLPSHREVVAAWMLDHLEYGLRGSHEALPRLAEAEGPCGPAMVLALVHGLAAEFPEARVAATDALLGLVSSDVDTAILGTEIGTLASGGEIMVSRVADPLSQAAALDRVAVARIVLNALPPLLRSPKPPNGTADLLALASRQVAPGSPVAPHIANEVAMVADRTGSTRLVTEARRLHRILSADASVGRRQTVPRPTVARHDAAEHAMTDAEG